MPGAQDDQLAAQEAADIAKILLGYADDAGKREARVDKTAIAEDGTIIARVALKYKEIHDQHATWPHVLKRLMVAFFLFQPRRMTDTCIHEHVELLHILSTGSHLRAHKGMAHLFRDGAWVKYGGIPSEGLLDHMRGQLLALEGIFQHVGEQNPLPTTKTQILECIEEFRQEAEQNLPLTSVAIISRCCTYLL